MPSMRRHFRFNIGQMLLLTALVGLVMALCTTIYQRMSGTFAPEAVSFSPDGQAVAARFTDGTVNVFSSTGKRRGSLDSRKSWINMNDRGALQLIDADTVLVTNDRAQFELWQLDTQRPIATFGRAGLSPFDNVTSVSRDGSTAASVRFGATPGIDLWDVQTQQRRSLPGGGGSPNGLVLSDDGSRIATVNGQQNITVSDSATGETIFTDESGKTPLEYRAFSADMSHWAAIKTDYSSPDLKLQAYVVSDDSQFKTEVDGYPTAMALSPDGRHLALLDATELNVWDTTTVAGPPQKIELSAGTRNPFAEFLNTTATDVEFSPDGTKLLVASAGEVALLDVKTMQRDKVYWRIGHNLGIFFFLPAFIGWAVLWGLARRRQMLSERAALARAADENPSPMDEAAVAWLLPTPPKELIVAWVLMGVGGVLAICVSMWLTLAQDSCWALTPFPYIELFIGIVALSSGAGRRFDGLTRVGVLQIVSMVCCDALNLTFGVISLILINQTGARRYLAQMNEVSG